VSSEPPRAAVEYDPIAASYDQRFSYSAGERKGVAAALERLCGEVRAERILEVGCGTGRWLAMLQNPGREAIGLDRSSGMLREAKRKVQAGLLVQADAGELPFSREMFDLVFCVSAFHHFDDQRGFLQKARRLIRPGGALAVIGMNPHAGRDQWYLYEYFRGTYETDLQRYPKPDTFKDWMIGAGFRSVEQRIVDRIADTRKGRTVFDDPMLGRAGTSALAALTDAEYHAGLARIRSAIARSEALGDEVVFPVDLSLNMMVGRLAPGCDRRRAGVESAHDSPCR
jgi:ubiquinone/menaquinone biosynthesis C-methylase UbiE